MFVGHQDNYIISSQFILRIKITMPQINQAPAGA
jgi:hypothetical protein